jgi:alkanesulfonate monooxygenase SsuD/methylene tetrahydromethanopterin reductase-like flavin-dependent oxidoreductase (luciferase family)
VAFAGDAATVADQLRRLVDAGATELVAMPFGFDQDHRRTLELLGDLSGPG